MNAVKSQNLRRSVSLKTVSAVTLDDTAPTLTGGLGISKWDARLKLLIPVYIDAGVYRATLSLTVA